MFDGVNDHHLTPCNCDAAGVRLVLRLHLRYRLQRRTERVSRVWITSTRFSSTT